jgi:hypothetical protein
MYIQLQKPRYYFFGMVLNKPKHKINKTVAENAAVILFPMKYAAGLNSIITSCEFAGISSPLSR